MTLEVSEASSAAAIERANVSQNDPAGDLTSFRLAVLNLFTLVQFANVPCTSTSTFTK